VSNSERKILYLVARGNLEILILATLNADAKTANEIIQFLNTKIGVLFSPGTIYPKLWKLEKEGCIFQAKEDKKFQLREEGRHRLKKGVTSLLLIGKFLGETLK